MRKEKGNPISSLFNPDEYNYVLLSPALPHDLRSVEAPNSFLVMSDLLIATTHAEPVPRHLTPCPDYVRKGRRRGRNKRKKNEMSR